MILYDLVCHREHAFDSWFRNSGVVEKLIKAGEVNCPVCGSRKVSKALQAPRIGKSSDDAAPPARSGQALAAAMDNTAAEAFAELRQAIEKNFEHVGERFPEEARRIHYGEAPSRAIYGDASREQTRALRDEGIEVYAIPGKRRTNA